MLTQGAAAGTYNKVEVVSADGLVPVDAGVAPITVALSTTEVYPSDNLNRFGGDELTIKGTGLPTSIDQVDVTFSDNTKCTVISTSDSELKCITDGFDASTIDTATPYSLSVTVNSVTDSTNTVQLSSET